MKPAAKLGDHVLATDTHTCGGAPVPVPFAGALCDALSPDVRAEHRPIALQGSVAENSIPHMAPPGPPFDVPPTKRGVVVGASATVFANHRPVARSGDAVRTCNDPVDLPVGRIVAGGMVIVGG